MAVLLIGIGMWLHQKQKEAHQAIQAVIKDAELFQLIHKNNHFITAEQLVEAVGMELKKAKNHLAYLSYFGALQGFYDINGSHVGIYQLVEEVPLEPIPKMDIYQMTEEEIIEVILLYASDYQVTLAELVVIFDIDIYEAKVLLRRLLKSKKISRLFKGMQYIYIIHSTVRQPQKKDKSSHLIQQELEQIRTKQLPEKSERLKIPDAEVIQLAIEHDGCLTPTLLCLKTKISIEEAKYKLEQLYEQGAFLMNVDESNYVIQYQLRDKFLLD